MRLLALGGRTSAAESVRIRAYIGRSYVGFPCERSPLLQNVAAPVRTLTASGPRRSARPSGKESEPSGAQLRRRSAP